MKNNNKTAIWPYLILGIIIISTITYALTTTVNDQGISTQTISSNQTQDGFWDVSYFNNNINATLSFAGDDGKVFIPCGEYTINSPIIWHTGQIIKGENKECVTIGTGSAWSGYAMMMPHDPKTDNTDLRISGLSLDGNNKVFIPLFLNHTKLSIFEDIEISEYNLTGIYLDQDNYYTEIRDSIIADGPNTTGVTNKDNEVTFRNVRTYAKVGFNLTYGDNIHLDGVRIDGSNTQTGIIINGSNGVLITGTRIELSTTPGRTCLNLTLGARRVVMIGGLITGCTVPWNDASAGELDLISVGGLSSDYYKSFRINITYASYLQLGQIRPPATLQVYPNGQTTYAFQMDQDNYGAAISSTGSNYLKVADNLTLSTYTGSGNQYLCVNATGQIYRNTTCA